MAPRADLRVGRVVRRTVEALRRSWLVLLVLGLPTVVLSNALFGFLRVTGRIEDPGADVLAAFVGAPGENLVVSLAGILFSGGAVAAVLGALGGSPLSVKGAFVESGRHFGAQFVITLLSTIAIAVGLVLLIVPGLLLWARWFVAPAVRVAERRSGSESMGRSADLTEAYASACSGSSECSY